MKKIYILLFVCGSTAAMAQKNSTDYTDALHLLDRWIEAERDYKHLPGLSASITKDQEVLWSKAYGLSNVTNKVPAHCNCSNNKVGFVVGYNFY